VALDALFFFWFNERDTTKALAINITTCYGLRELLYQSVEFILEGNIHLFIVGKICLMPLFLHFFRDSA